MQRAFGPCDQGSIGRRRDWHIVSAAESPINRFQVGSQRSLSHPETTYLNYLGFLASRWNNSCRKTTSRTLRSQFKKLRPPARLALFSWRSRKPFGQRESVNLLRQKSPESSS